MVLNNVSKFHKILIKTTSGRCWWEVWTDIRMDTRTDVGTDIHTGVTLFAIVIAGAYLCK